VHARVLDVDEYRQLINYTALAYGTQTAPYPATDAIRPGRRGLVEEGNVLRTVANARPLAAARLSVLALLALLGGCSHLRQLEPSHWHSQWHPHWPWRHAPPAPEAPVNELVVATEAGTAAPALVQSWNRNTLRVALNGVAGEGELRLRPVPGHGWPIRLEFAVQPGSFAHLELRGEQRVILSVPAAGGLAVLQVPQGVIAPATAEVRLHYGP
jgi:hypothetical protein